MVIISQYIQISNVMWHRCVCSAAPDALQPHGLQLTRVLCPWDFSGKNTGVGCHFLLQGMSLTQCTNPHLLCLLHEQVVFFLSFFFFATSTNWEARHLICAVLFLVAQLCLTLGTKKGKEFGKKVISLLSFPFQLMKA